MIAINWGSSNFRAWKLSAAGMVEAEKSSGRGAVQVAPGGFAEALMAEVGEWVRGGESRILMCGMVGARRGWKEAPYVRVPAAFDQVVGGVIRLEVDMPDLPRLDARIVPGLLGADESGVPEVMRGEETEIFGCANELAGSAHLCLPGTHTKWVRMEGGKVAAFSTAMTGDLYKAVREGTILSISLSNGTQDEPKDDATFLRGVARSKQAGALAHHLFGVRALVLAGELAERSASSYLSGLLIGHEVKTMVKEGERVHLIGDPGLCALYATALHEFGASSSVEPKGAALRGLIRISTRISTRIAEKLEW